MGQVKHIRFACYSDIHHHEYTNGVTGDDVERMEQEFTDLCKEVGAHFWIFGGDRFLSRNPLDISRKRADTALKNRRGEGIVLVGNHDRWTKSPHSGHNMYVVGLYDIPNIFVFDKIGGYHQIYNGCKVAFHALPAGHKASPTSFVFNHDTDFNICLFHDIVKGSKYTNGIVAPEGISPGLLDLPEFAIVLGGDNHQPQDLGLTNTLGVYIGAPMQHNWGDVGSDRGYLIVDLWNDNGKITRKIEYRPSSSPRFLREEIRLSNDEDLSNFVTSIGSRWKNNIVRITFTGLPDMLAGLELTRLQSKLLHASGARQVKATTKYDEQQTTIPDQGVTARDDGQEWKDFLNFKKPELAGLDIDRLAELGLEYIIDADNS